MIQKIVKLARSQFWNAGLWLHVVERRHQMLIFKLTFDQTFDQILLSVIPKLLRHFIKVLFQDSESKNVQFSYQLRSFGFQELLLHLLLGLLYVDCHNIQVQLTILVFICLLVQ